MRALGKRRPIVVPDGPNQRWSLVFVSDELTDGRRVMSEKLGLGVLCPAVASLNEKSRPVQVLQDKP